MGINTTIAWTRSSRNFWSGCTKVGPGCDGCYAEAFQRWIRGVNVVTQQAKNWGPGAPRIPHLDGAVKDLRRWNKLAGVERATGKLQTKEPWHSPGFWPVFPNSHSDAFDNDVPDRWREILFATAEECSNLTIQLVTKRIGNVRKMVPEHWLKNGFPPNVWLIITTVNQDEVDRDAEKLFEFKSIAVRGFSFEPLIAEIDMRPYLHVARMLGFRLWGIPGGESDQSGHETRPFVLGWAKRIVRDFREYGQAVFVKQLGSKPMNREGERHPQKHPKGEDISEWPTELQVQEFPI